jgi:hypothetical protein
MIRYVPSPAAADLTVALWGLARPAHLRTADDTSDMFGWVDDLQNPPQRWLEVDTEFAITIHPDAAVDEVAVILQPWVTAGHLPTSTIPDLAATIEAKKGQSMIVWAAFPQFFKDHSKTEQEMEDADWLPGSNTLFSVHF